MATRKEKPQRWSRKGRCPSCSVGSGSKHASNCSFDYSTETAKSKLHNGMKTHLIERKKNEWNGSIQEQRIIIEPPYTVFGSPSLPESQSIIVKVGGLRKMIKGLADDDSFRIEWFAGTRATEYSFYKKVK